MSKPPPLGNINPADVCKVQIIVETIGELPKWKTIARCFDTPAQIAEVKRDFPKEKHIWLKIIETGERRLLF